MSMSVRKSQVHKEARSQDADKRLCLVDDLKEVQVHIQVKLIRTSSSLKSKITTSCSPDEVKKTREKGFEQTKECYLTEVIPFFKTVKEHFKGILTALIKEVKEMKEIFEQMKAEVEQNAMDKKCA
ncbi:hypothetical protein Tco_0491546 [Tanacetum coccineum]